VLQDLDGTGKIRYTEFLAATIEAQGAISEERLAEAFDRLDSDDSGYIDANNLIEMLGDEFPEDEIHAIIDEADITRDNRISYSEFLALWEVKNEQKRESLFEEIQVPSSTYSLMSSVTAQTNDDTPLSSSEAEIMDETDLIARANFIEGKYRSVRKSSVAESDELCKILYGNDGKTITATGDTPQYADI
jgi:hypothetical protein